MLLVRVAYDQYSSKGNVNVAKYDFAADLDIPVESLAYPHLVVLLHGSLRPIQFYLEESAADAGYGDGLPMEVNVRIGVLREVREYKKILGRFNLPLGRMPFSGTTTKR